jgi:(E)-4-hydroxy-3-methylbut-2-enyl-diphosphate synthase
MKIAAAVERKLAGFAEPLTVAVMGCMVNGPGEAREADFGVACGRGTGVLFRKGRVVRKVREAGIAEALTQEIMKKRGIE